MNDGDKQKRRLALARKHFEQQHYRPTRGGRPTPYVVAVSSATKVSPEAVCRVVDAALSQAMLELEVA